MFETYNTPRHEIMAITSMQAVRLCKPAVEAPRETQHGSATQGSGGQSLTMVQAEKMLKALVEEGWLDKSAKGFYSLSPRALMELRGWLFDTYNDVEDGEDDDQERAVKIKRCLACKEIITTVSVRHLIAPGSFCLPETRVSDARN
jgi:non-structural maintenance of chromosomes element 1